MTNAWHYVLIPSFILPIRIRMKTKFWVFQAPLILLFTIAYWVTELGVQGQLTYPAFRETLFPSLSRISNLFTDLKFHVRGAKPFKNKVVVVEVDSQSLETLGRWPWHRDLSAHLIDKTFQAGAKVVGLDIIFSEPDPRVPESLAAFLMKQKLGHLIAEHETDPILEQVIRKYSDRLVLGWTTEQSCQPYYEGKDLCPVEDPNALALYPPEYQKFSLTHFDSKEFRPSLTPLISFFAPIANIPQYNDVAQHAGYLNAFLDADGYVRRSSLVVFAGGKPYPSLPLEMARIGLKEELRLVTDSSHRVSSISFAKSGREVPVSPLGVVQINFRGPSRSFPHISALDVMSESDRIEDATNQVLTGKSKSELLKDAYVLIGVSALGVFDMRHFPLESNAPGVDGHANILDNLLGGDPLQTGSKELARWIILLLMIFGAVAFTYGVERLEAVPALGLFLVTFVGLGLIDTKIFFEHNYNLNTSFLCLELVALFGATIAGKYVAEERNKKFIRGAFAKYVAPVVVDSILKDPTKLSLGGEKKELTILFSDIRGFTTFSEKMDAKALASFLNDYLGIMTGLVFANQGTLDKYIGDAVMAFWGAPLNQPGHALNACHAAIQMMQALEKNKDRFKSQYGIDVNIGVGVNSGVVNVGNMGSEQNFEYTVIGDHVNLASRLEGLTKEYGASILTTRFTFDSIAAAGGQPPVHRVLDDVKVKGKKKAIELIQLMYQDCSKEGLELFAEGRRLYRARKWDAAIDKFKSASQVIHLDPSKPDIPSEKFIERCEGLKANPPGEDWDGSWEMFHK